MLKKYFTTLKCSSHGILLNSNDCHSIRLIDCQIKLIHSPTVNMNMHSRKSGFGSYEWLGCCVILSHGFIHGEITPYIVKCEILILCAYSISDIADHELSCVGYWMEDMRSYMVTYDEEDAVSKYRCWVSI